MDVSQLLDDLNEPQREAVTAPVGNVLVLAGAGSGKTRVLVHRIAWLIQVENISPFNILAVTFTNKAAGEMRGRLEQLLHIATRGMWVGTFHSLAHRMLRTHWQLAGLPQNFQILDSDDQYRLIKRTIRALELDENQWAPRELQWFINKNKDEGLRPKHIDDQSDPYQKMQIKIYQAYEEACLRGGLLDFAELLLRVHELWLEHPELLQHYQQRFNYLLVDEFQDTNSIQYAWLKLLAGAQTKVMIVGDDDQSIYGWRGAKIENIHRFCKDFPETKTIRLEQNYRSTGNILRAANHLIDNNGERLGKNLWTAGTDGEAISVYAGFNEVDEARYIVARIQDWLNQGNRLADAAVLYRSNAQSRVLEEAFIQAGIPYRVYGGLRFFERAEIKDALAYLRLVSHRNDDAAFERVVNTPTRGIGDRTVSVLRQVAREENISLWNAAIQVIANQQLAARANNALKAFIELIDGMAANTKELPLDEQTEQVIFQSGVRMHYGKIKSEKNQARLENLDELITATKHFEPDEQEDLPILAAFISHAALEAGERQGDSHQDCAQLMTLHSAKGLEFPLVFIAGAEEGLFPHRMSASEPGRLEEERRLCYVGMTRAMQKLYFTYAELRRLYGKEEYHRPSRFLTEIPKELLESVRMPAKVSRSSGVSKRSPTSMAGMAIGDTGFKLGQAVSHPKFGEGIVTNFEGSGTHARIQVQFHAHDAKWLVLSYANLTPLEMT